MPKFNFYDDYSEGAHPRILQALQESNLQQELGYGRDQFSNKARRQILKFIGNEKSAVCFVSGGTQANLIVLAALLKPYESVIAANTAHINVHEAGAIEATGHKINVVPTTGGKLTPRLVEKVLAEHKDEHMVLPRVVFISNSTEVGTVYSKEELQALSAFCRKNRLYLYLDGARLGAALCAKNSGLLPQDLGKLVDVFYIGGTKNGALLGEAIVINNRELQPNFAWHLKQRGALLAKGRVLGIQFQELFRDNLYLDLAKQANVMAEELAAGIRKLGYKFLVESTSNQIFPILPRKVIKILEPNYGFYVWKEIDQSSSAIRLVTSWATNKENIHDFLTDLAKASK